MTRLSTLCVLLVALLQPQRVATRQIINAGGEFRKTCTSAGFGYTIQFFIDKTEIKVFSARAATATFRLVSSGTTIVPDIARHTNRYRVQETNGRYVLIISNVMDSDSAWYGCREFDVNRNVQGGVQASEELLVPGPFSGVFWTTEYEIRDVLNLDIARQNEIPNGGTVRVSDSFTPGIACVLFVSNVEPAFNITIGRFGQSGSVDITDQFTVRSTGLMTNNTYVGIVKRDTFYFVKRRPFTQTSLRDVHCRASLFGKTYEKSVNIQVTSRPKTKACDPMNFNAMVGSKNVKLTCMFEAHPEPTVEWILPGGSKINARSNNPRYTVTNVASFEGLFTTLTISEVTAYDNNFGRINIDATNSEGSGRHFLFFTEVKPVLPVTMSRVTMSRVTLSRVTFAPTTHKIASTKPARSSNEVEGTTAAMRSAGVVQSSAALITMMMWLLVWTLK